MPGHPAGVCPPAAGRTQHLIPTAVKETRLWSPRNHWPSTAKVVRGQDAGLIPPCRRLLISRRWLCRLLPRLPSIRSATLVASHKSASASVLRTLRRGRAFRQDRRRRAALGSPGGGRQTVSALCWAPYGTGTVPRTLSLIGGAASSVQGIDDQRFSVGKSTALNKNLSKFS